jgi:hypothetical protein
LKLQRQFENIHYLVITALARNEEPLQFTGDRKLPGHPRFSFVWSEEQAQMSKRTVLEAFQD